MFCQRNLTLSENAYSWVEKRCVRSGIRTHAHRSGLRPERSALDRSAILTVLCICTKIYPLSHVDMVGCFSLSFLGFYTIL